MKMDTPGLLILYIFGSLLLIIITVAIIMKIVKMKSKKNQNQLSEGIIKENPKTVIIIENADGQATNSMSNQAYTIEKDDKNSDSINLSIGMDFGLNYPNAPAPNAHFV